MVDAISRNSVCVRERYTRQSEDFLLFLGLEFLLLKGLFFPSQYQYFWVEIVWDKRWHPICNLDQLKTNTAVTRYLKPVDMSG